MNCYRLANHTAFYIKSLHFFFSHQLRQQWGILMYGAAIPEKCGILSAFG